MASCAAMLAQATGCAEVVFGCMVSGRNSLPAELQAVCGPCLNEIPLRATFPTQFGVLGEASPITHVVYQQVRDQLLESSAYDTVSFDKVATHCTSWSRDIKDFVLSAHYQNTFSDLDTTTLLYRCYDIEKSESGLSVPKTDYNEVEGTPLPDGQVCICVMGKSSLYTHNFLDHLIKMVCDNL